MPTAASPGWPLREDCRSERFPLTWMFSLPYRALYLSMKDTEKGVRELNLEKDKKIFNHCFTGKDLARLSGAAGGATLGFSVSLLCGVGRWRTVDGRGHRIRIGEQGN